MMVMRKTIRFFNFVTFTLTIVFWSGLALAQPVGHDEFYSSDENQNKGRPFRHIPPKYPECADLVCQYWEMTDGLHALAEELRQSVRPESSEIIKKSMSLLRNGVRSSEKSKIACEMPMETAS